MRRNSALLFLAAAALLGCGGGGSQTAAQLNRTGQFALKVNWPAASRSILSESESLEVTVTDSAENVRKTVINRPATEVTLSNLAAGSAVVTVTAYSDSSATGTILGVATASVEILAGKTVSQAMKLSAAGGNLAVTITDDDGLSDDDEVIEDDPGGTTGGGDGIDDDDDVPIDDDGEGDGGADDDDTTPPETPPATPVSAKIRFRFEPNQERYARGEQITYAARLVKEDGSPLPEKKLYFRLKWDGGSQALGLFKTDSSGWCRVAASVPTGNKDNVHVIVAEEEELVVAPTTSTRIPIGR